jgi:hypothetical protein
MDHIGQLYRFVTLSGKETKLPAEDVRMSVGSIVGADGGLGVHRDAVIHQDGQSKPPGSKAGALERMKDGRGQVPVNTHGRGPRQEN